MITQTKDLAKDSVGDMSTYERPSDTHHLTTMTRIVGVCTAVGESIIYVIKLSYRRERKMYIIKYVRKKVRQFKDFF